MLVAIVEDNIGIRKNLVELFELYDYETISSENGRDGLSKIMKYKPNIVVADIMMPDMDGLTMVEKMRAEPDFKHIPIIFLTAKSSLDDRIRGLETGAVDYITKPFESKELLQKVSNLLELGKRQMVNALSTPNKQTFESSDQAFLTRLRTLIEANISNEKLDVYMLALALNFSTSSIHKKVKQITGKSTNQFIREYRLERAKQMIEDQHANISEIAFSLGFNSVSYFSKSYKDYFGQNPKKSSSKNI
jgi:DNA-binding response OmpR family regulator